MIEEKRPGGQFIERRCTCTKSAYILDFFHWLVVTEAEHTILVHVVRV